MVATISPLSVSYNPWFGCAIELLVRMVIVGMAWSWTIPRSASVSPGRFAIAAVATAWTLLVGLAISILVATLLAEAGVYTVAVETGVLTLVALAGFLCGAIRDRAGLVRHMTEQIPGAALCAFAFCLIMWLPHRGEWIAGGWDPGIYVNQGVMVSRTSTFHPGPEPLLSELTDEEFETFTRPVLNYIEYLPVVPVDPESRRIEHFFFRATPSVVAILYRCGGLRAATRINHVLGFVSLVVLFALVLDHGRRLPRAWFVVFLMAVQPIWLFMLSFPTSEMLQLVLVCGLGALTTVRSHKAVREGWIPLLLFLAVINRFSFFPFAGVYLCMMTWINLPHPDRGQFRYSRWVQAAAASTGLVYDVVFCSVVVGRLDELAVMLVVSGFALIALALGVEALRFAGLVDSWFQGAGTRTVGIGLAAVAGLAMAADRVLPGAQHLNTIGNALGILRYLEIFIVGTAAVGYALFVLRPREDDDRGYAGFLFFLGSAVVVTLCIDAIAGLYPWAARRHLVYTVPLVSLLAGDVLGALWETRDRFRLSHSIALVLAGGLAAGTWQKAGRALSDTEFNGLSEILDNASSQIDSDAVVIADHFRWGTPLKMLHGHAVLNGEILWDAADPDRWERALATLKRLRDGGREVLWFTSTEDGVGVYDDIPGTLEEIWSSGDVVVVDMAHHADMRDFKVRGRHKVFALSRWTP